MGNKQVWFILVKVLKFKGRSCGEQAVVVYMSERSYSRGLNMHVFINNHKEQLWKGHLFGCSYKRSSFKQCSPAGKPGKSAQKKIPTRKF